MQFTKNTSQGRPGKFLIKVILLIFVLFLGIILINKIDFPVPNKKIEKIIKNENFKILR